MSKFSIEFECDNAAFEEDPAQEVSRILTRTASHVLNGHTEGRVKDINGNTIGRWSLELDDDDE